jgi:hypothetical protein
MLGRNPQFPVIFTVYTLLMGHTNSMEEKSNQRKIFLSVVMTGRNDDWGGNFTDRLRYSLESIYYQATVSQLKVEVVLVDYNPPYNTAPMWSVVQDIVQRTTPSCSFLLTTVPAEVHTALRQRPRWRLFDARLLEYIGKNVGLRLAGGRFVLVTNPDIILGADLIAFLAAGTLLEGTYYTLPRSNLGQAIPPDTPYVSALRARKEVFVRSGLGALAENMCRGQLAAITFTPFPNRPQDIDTFCREHARDRDGLAPGTRPYSPRRPLRPPRAGRCH